MNRHKIAINWFCLLLFCLSACSQKGSPLESAAIAKLQRLGGKVEIDLQDTDQRAGKVYLHSTKVTDADLQNIELLTHVRTLSLGRTQITDAGLVHLKRLSNLETLSLNLTSVTDAGLQHLRGLSKLKTLNLLETGVTDAGVRDLKQALPQVAIGYVKAKN